MCLSPRVRPGVPTSGATGGMPCKPLAPRDRGGKRILPSGAAVCIQEPAIRHVVVGETGIHVEPGEVMFELLVEPVIVYTRLVAPGSPEERPGHRIWPTTHR